MLARVDGATGEGEGFTAGAGVIRVDAHHQHGVAAPLKSGRRTPDVAPRDLGYSGGYTAVVRISAGGAQ